MNVLLALAHEIHSHHRTALSWAESILDDEIVYCRFTQLGLLRLLTNKAAMGDGVFTQAEAWSVHDELASFWRMTLVEEPSRTDEAFRRLTQSGESSSKVWADAYLAAFAEVDGLTLVTFDHALARMSPGSVLLRSPN